YKKSNFHPLQGRCPIAGTYNAVLAVKDSYGLIGTDIVTITVSAVSQAPEVTVNAVPSSGSAPRSVNFTASVSSHNPIILYLWDFNGDGNYDWSNTSTGNTSYTYGAAGTFNATLMVMDSEGLSGTASKTITITSGVGVPTVTAFATPTSGSIPLPVSFDGTVSDDGTILAYLWDFNGDGSFDWSSINTTSANYTYTNFGTYITRLRVIDNTGLTGENTVTIIANPSSALSVWLTTPMSGDTIAGSAVSVVAQTSDPTNTQSVLFQYKLNSGSTWTDIGSADNTSQDGFSTIWNTTGLTEGIQYDLRAIATDTAYAQHTSSTVTVTIGTAPPGFAIFGVKDMLFATNASIAEWQTVSGDHYKQQKLYANRNNTVRLFDGTVIDIPYGAISQDTTIMVKIMNTLGNSSGSIYRGVIRDITIGSGTYNLNKIITIQIPYNDANNNGIVDGTALSENLLFINWYDASVGGWKKIPTSLVSAGDNLVRATVAHLSQFRVYGSTTGLTTVEQEIWEFFNLI
ncbi:MAG: PKD domain-containing protein, partial [bacterium]|nr:PKD domain-containing protein [bacterium]